MFSVESIVYAWDNQLNYMLALLEDLSDSQMLLQPQGKMNHPAWIVGTSDLSQSSSTCSPANADVKDDENLFAGAAGRQPGGVRQEAEHRAVCRRARTGGPGPAVQARRFQRKPSLERGPTPDSRVHAAGFAAAQKACASGS
jgi:hypothetical protein